MANNLQLVLTPALAHLYDLKGKSVVIVDILRATTSICVALEVGAKRILPVATPMEAMLFRDFDFLCAAERDAVKVEGFDLGNSPFEFASPLLKDRSIAFTTTNGTKAIKLAKDKGAAEIVIGSFLNLKAVADYLLQIKMPVVILCAGWKDKFNIEDTLFAGALVNLLKSHFTVDCDAAQASETLFLSVKGNLESFVRQSSHARRFQELHAPFDDVKFCLQMDTMKVVPAMRGEYITLSEAAESVHGR